LASMCASGSGDGRCQSSRDGGNDPVVRLKDQIVKVAGGYGAHDRELVSGVVSH
jgi:hypothetical protein